MHKTFLIAAAFTALIGTQALAQNLDCSEDSAMKVQARIEGMTGIEQKQWKEKAMADLDMAKAAMTAKDMDQCASHLNSAMTFTGKS